MKKTQKKKKMKWSKVGKIETLMNIHMNKGEYNIKIYDYNSYNNTFVYNHIWSLGTSTSEFLIFPGKWVHDYVNSIMHESILRQGMLVGNITYSDPWIQFWVFQKFGPDILW